MLMKVNWSRQICRPSYWHWISHLSLLPKTYTLVTLWSGRVIAQVVNWWLPTAAVGFDPRSGHVWFVVDKVALGQVFSQVLQFPLPILIPSTASHSSSSTIRGWYNRPVTGRHTKWTQSHRSHPTPRNYKKLWWPTECANESKEALRESERQCVAMSIVEERVQPQTWGGERNSFVSEHHTTKTYTALEVQIHGFLTLSLNDYKWLLLSPNRFIPLEWVPGGPPLWSSVQSSWLQIQRARIRFPILERGPLSLVRRVEELLEWKSSGSGLENRN
jgi:hypothetical protein